MTDCDFHVKFYRITAGITVEYMVTLLSEIAEDDQMSYDYIITVESIFVLLLIEVKLYPLNLWNHVIENFTCNQF